MKKSDLKTGMLFEKDNGEIFQIFLNTPLGDIYINEKGNHGDLKYIDESMCWSSSYQTSHIKKVYSPLYNYALLSFDLNKFKLIWEKKSKETIKIGEAIYDKAEFEEAVKNLKQIK